MNRYQPGDIVTVPYSGGPPGSRLRCEVLEGPRIHTRTGFGHRGRTEEVVAVHLRYLEGLEKGLPCTFQVGELQPLKD